MKKTLPFYPVLVGAFPILSVFSTNQSFLPLGELWRPLAVGVGGALVVWLLLSAVFRNLEKGAAAAAVVVGSFFWYRSLTGPLPVEPDSAAALVIWSALTLALAGLAGWKWKWHGAAMFFSIVLTAMPLSKIVWTAATSSKTRVIQSKASATKTSQAKPDIIYVILDGYGRTDVFKRAYGFSDEPFIKGLEERGFYVAHQAHSNYSQTELSIGSSLNGDFMQNLEKEHPELSFKSRGGLRELLTGNKVFARLRQEDYLISKITTGFPAMDDLKADRQINKTQGFSLLETTLLDSTPIGFSMSVADSMFDRRREWILQAFESLGSLGGQSSRPRFTFVHIIAPHPPFSFGPNGEAKPKPPKRTFGYWDASDYMAYGGDKDNYTQGYADQATFIGKKVLEAVDRISAGNGPKPIIIIQGDHGPKRGLDQSSFEKTDPTECFPILNAYLAPPEIRQQLYPTITPVNSFRTILRTFFGDNLPNLPDQSWYSPYGEPFDFTEVTDRIEKK